MNPKKPISPFRLASLLRLEKDPRLAFKLFKNPNPGPKTHPKPFRYSLLSYDLIITKLGRAKMFDEMREVLLQLKREARFVPSEALFCIVISLYGRGRRPDDARKVFDEMPFFRCRRTIKSCNSLLNAYLMCKAFDEMRELLGDIERDMMADACTYNILIRGLCIDGRLDDAWEVFEIMTKRGVRPNAVTFGALIHGFCLNLNLKKAFQLKNDMYRVYKVFPNAHVYASLIKGLCKVGELSWAFRLKEEMVKKKIKLDSAIYSTLISGLYKFGKKEEASEVLEEMKLSGCKLDNVIYNVIINGLCKDKDIEAAYQVLDEMVEKGLKPDVISYNVILSELCKVGRVNEANDLFEDMPRRGVLPDVVSYRILFDGLYEGMQFKEASLLLDEMVFKGFTPCSASRYKFIQSLCQERNEDLLLSVLNNLSELNVIDIDLWKMVTAMLFKDDELSTSSELLGNLIV